MKKLLFFMLFLAAGTATVYPQGDLRLGINVGLPVGDADDFTSFQLGADFSYLFNVAEGFDVGPMIGYSHFFGEEVDLGGGMGSMDFDDIQFLPIAASGRFNLAETFFLGADLGYAVGINDGNDGGFYYRPKVGFDLVGVGLIASYSGVSVDGGSFSSINLGIEFGL